MSIVGDKMTAGELKTRVIKKKFGDGILVIGKLSTCVEGGYDHYYHIHNDEQIPVNVGVLLVVRKENS